jgi:2-keto-4-pentenoate hydratase
VQRAELERVVEEFWESRQRGVFFPPAWLDRLGLEDAYQVQLGLMARRIAEGARHVGWKVGLTSAAMQEQFRVREPVFGYLLDDAPHPTGAQFEVDRLIRPGVENEVCVIMGGDVDLSRADEGAVRRAVAGVCPALEIVETRGDFTRYLAVAVADNVQQKAIVLGPETRPLPRDLNLAAVHARVVINGQEAATATGAAVLGDPLASVLWLARKLAGYGLGLKAGQLIMTGSLTRQFPLHKGDHVATAFTPLGTVEAFFV